MKQDFMDCLNNKVGFKGFGIPADKQSLEVPFTFEGQEYKLSHGENFMWCSDQPLDLAPRISKFLNAAKAVV